MRRTEVVELAYANWNRTEGTLTLIGKGNKERRVYCPTTFRVRCRLGCKTRGQGGTDALAVKLGSGNLFEEVGLHPGSVYRLLKERSGLAILEASRRTIFAARLRPGCWRAVAIFFCSSVRWDTRP